jgi:uncharacterized protein with PhoU and TrkA domain
VVGRALRDSELRSRWRLNVVGVRRGGRLPPDPLPDPDYVVQPGDVLLLAGSDARLRAFTR